ncbi:MAG: HD domain-containing phosphohydrolase [Nitrospirota bacterium]|mgnify:FL=1
MNAFKNLLTRYFEPVLVAVIILILLFIDMFVVDKVIFLYFYFIPVLVAGYYIGKKGAVLSSIMTVLIVTLRLVISPETFSIRSKVGFDLVFQIVTWGSFLVLSSYVVGSLYEEKEARYRDLKQSYVGVIEILVKYIESVDRYTKGHSVRVADIAMDIARSMSLTREVCENIKVAALLHDVGKIDVSMDLIKKAAALTKDERQVMNSHSERGANILNKVGNILSDAVPIVLAHHEYFNKKEGDNLKEKADIPLGARIIAVADTYDAIVTDRPYRKGKLPWQALEEIGKSSGTQFDPEVVEAFRHVVSTYMEEQEHVSV